ncbi:formiminotetrahydrofolate cyclodeaminase [Saccharopolyspora erythraea NRRL 2338]|uniref:Cyclodeaminase/cyclohydrolase family protein n=2 Tax=Saccharopolyspora erythraea TaxID=1836 RepID=A0ABP3P9V3_SACER|nr:cyclodeaminase/cyclohydrolase family protein [Saccharopolyspora erythraea]EQD81464.1 methenyltetrahydrofolate cyclohydrolase [Saccharopolyspora erythraea D]PFG97446.1 formiminotetrahydrofolate cyclodeaminase [Saccharopolyspora erythraea NRRL 2338]QRK87625.1 cyclodeaminase/cyclohydrolase family protein [Saccharopolyspora erythraea]CAM03766.1 probable methenyltetrahydrofolate cyclohydrolase [Saccharopolyspora erythraea NRRL 2338]
MRSDTIDGFLSGLAARIPAPGGGATAGLHAAQGAALVAMVARYSNGPKYAEHAATIDRVRESADDLCERSLELAEQDVAAFGAVGQAYGLPRSTPVEKTARSQAIASALAEAGRVPARVLAVAERIIALAEELRPVGNPNVISDIAAAADAARAAASTARVNVEINLCASTELENRAELVEAIASTDEILLQADKTTAAVREQILR